MNLKGIILSERSQSQKVMNCVVPLKYNYCKGKTTRNRKLWLQELEAAGQGVAMKEFFWVLEMYYKLIIQALDGSIYTLQLRTLYRKKKVQVYCMLFGKNKNNLAM